MTVTCQLQGIWGLVGVNNVFTFDDCFFEMCFTNRCHKIDHERVFVAFNVETIARCHNLNGGFHWPLLSKDFYVFSRSIIKWGVHINLYLIHIRCIDKLNFHVLPTRRKWLLREGCISCAIKGYYCMGQTNQIYGPFNYLLI